MSVMSELKNYLEKAHPDFVTSALYFGYMDMTYFAFTSPELKAKKLKVAIVEYVLVEMPDFDDGDYLHAVIDEILAWLDEDASLDVSCEYDVDSWK